MFSVRIPWISLRNLKLSHLGAIVGAVWGTICSSIWELFGNYLGNMFWTILELFFGLFLDYFRTIYLEFERFFRTICGLFHMKSTDMPLFNGEFWMK